MIFMLYFFSFTFIVSSILSLFISVLHLGLVCTFSVVLFLTSSLSIYTTAAPFHSFLSSILCVLSFFLITIIMLSFLSMCLCQFILLFHIIWTFYCISFPCQLFCHSNFSLFSLLFWYIATIFSQSFSFSSNRFMYYFLVGIPLCALWHLLLFCRGDMLCLIYFFCSCILSSTHVI